MQSTFDREKKIKQSEKRAAQHRKKQTNEQTNKKRHGITGRRRQERREWESVRQSH